MLKRKLATLAGATMLGLALVSTDATARGFGGGGFGHGGMGGGFGHGGMGGGFGHGGMAWHGARFGAFHGGWNGGWHGGWHGRGPFFAHGFHRRFFGGPFFYGAGYYGGYGGYGCLVWGPYGPVNVCYGPYGYY